VIRADRGSLDLIEVASEVAVQNVVGMTDTEVNVAVAVVGAKSSPVCTGKYVNAKPKAVGMNQEMVNDLILGRVGAEDRCSSWQGSSNLFL